MRKIIVIVFAGVLLFALSGSAWAKQEESPDKRWDSRLVEFSTYNDRNAQPPGAIDGLEPGAVIYTEPKDKPGLPLPRNSAMTDSLEDLEIDALANIDDLYFSELIKSKAHLLVSFSGDPGGNSVHLESTGGKRKVYWSKQDLSNVGGGPDPNLENLDGLEIYQTQPFPNAPRPWLDDANHYSQEGEPSLFSVLHQHGQYVPRAHVVAAITALGWEGSEGDVDVDALMVLDRDIEWVWDDDDTIIFSIRACGNWDGGEIVVLPFPTGGPAFFLEHGDTTHHGDGTKEWNTAFDIQTAFSVNTEEVDAIEALGFIGGGGPGGQTGVPSLTNWGLLVLLVLLVLSGVYVIYHRRRGAVRA